MFNPAIKVVDAPPQKEKKPLPVADGKEDFDFKLLEQAVAPPPPVKGAAPQTKHPLGSPQGTCSVPYIHRVDIH